MKLNFRFHHFAQCGRHTETYYQCTNTKAWKCAETWPNGEKKFTFSLQHHLEFNIKSEEELIKILT